jgi:hypothetical protein
VSWRGLARRFDEFNAPDSAVGIKVERLDQRAAAIVHASAPSALAVTAGFVWIIDLVELIKQIFQVLLGFWTNIR